MKICIPTLGNKGLEESVSLHFGSAPYFTIVDLENGNLELLENDNSHHEHGTCQPFHLIGGKGINMIVCGGMGRRAVQLFNAENIEVFLTDDNLVKEVIQNAIDGKLRKLSIEEACSGHDCH